MKPQPGPSTQEVLAGLVERVTFHNAENGFCVLRAKARGHRELVTVIGHAAIISAGEWITATGDWVNDRTHGQQFKARFLRTSAPTSADGIEKYLSSGMIRGVGPALPLTGPAEHTVSSATDVYRLLTTFGGRS
jgi:exodeoxyribonuclease V alpha subunit